MTQCDCLYVKSFFLVEWIAQDSKNSVGENRNRSNQPVFSTSDNCVFVELNHALNAVGMTNYSVVAVTEPVPAKNVYHTLST